VQKQAVALNDESTTYSGLCFFAQSSSSTVHFVPLKNLLLYLHAGTRCKQQRLSDLFYAVLTWFLRDILNKQQQHKHAVRAFFIVLNFY
tara:strand:+ start:32 stop:298 length:267 start_codon:yes stop_codon:yes gene_type:complete